ncbi:hypothetical protein [Clostridium sp.]|uniref:hypothetical protein n=1 Tax=Clostridium sp. TaxID=1506 RepID=UPI003216D7C5
MVRIIEKIYTSFKCITCRKETILLTNEVESTIRQCKYISCSHCGSRRIVKEKVTDDLRECMHHETWKKDKGKIRQVRFGGK